MSRQSRASRRRARRVDALERTERAIRERGSCVYCAISGNWVAATEGAYCERHFNEVNFPRALPLPDY